MYNTMKSYYVKDLNVVAEHDHFYMIFFVFTSLINKLSE